MRICSTISKPAAKLCVWTKNDVSFKCWTRLLAQPADHLHPAVDLVDIHEVLPAQVVVQMDLVPGLQPAFEAFRDRRTQTASGFAVQERLGSLRVVVEEQDSSRLGGSSFWQNGEEGSGQSQRAETRNSMRPFPPRISIESAFKTKASRSEMPESAVDHLLPGFRMQGSGRGRVWMRFPVARVDLATGLPPATGPLEAGTRLGAGLIREARGAGDKPRVTRASSVCDELGDPASTLARIPSIATGSKSVATMNWARSDHSGYAALGKRARSRIDFAQHVSEI